MVCLRMNMLGRVWESGKEISVLINLRIDGKGIWKFVALETFVVGTQHG